MFQTKKFYLCRSNQLSENEQQSLMSESFLLKNMYNATFYNSFCDALEKVVAPFDRQQFFDLIFDKDWEGKELKERMKHTTKVLHQFLEKDLAKAIQQLSKLIDIIAPQLDTEQSFEYMFFADYIEQYGQGEELASVFNGIEMTTQFTSAEFAVRPFIVAQQEATLAQMLAWSKHPNPNVRRLSSEGCRPRLPWGIALKALKKDPKPILPILENLKNDESEYVRRSVANNLNDISKDHPDIVIAIAKKWFGKTKATDKLIKHALRGLLKQGHKEALALFGYASSDDLKISNFKVEKAVIQLGEDQIFSFQLENTSEKALKVRLEYGVYYKKANGSLSRKVFQIGEKQYQPKSTTIIKKKQHFKPITTRKYHAGEHQITIIVNGEESEKISFTLKI